MLPSSELPMIVRAMTADGTRTLSAGKSLALFGLSPGELVGKNMREISAGNSAALADFRRVLAGESFRSQQTLDGVIWSTAYHAARDSVGLVTGLFAISEDISERAAIVTERLLDGVVRHRARFAILDLTGIENVETSTIS